MKTEEEEGHVRLEKTEEEEEGHVRLEKSLEPNV
jgi:hypothetical protein